MPNLYVGLGAVAVTGLFVRAVHDPVWWLLALTAAAAGFVPSFVQLTACW
jgi:hypothetical protein